MRERWNHGGALAARAHHVNVEDVVGERRRQIRRRDARHQGPDHLNRTLHDRKASRRHHEREANPERDVEQRHVGLCFDCAGGCGRVEIVGA